MQQLKIVLVALSIFIGSSVKAQETYSYENVDKHSYDLYLSASWKQLLNYGKEALKNKQDFTLLRLRLGYAAFMLNNFSEAIKHYDVVLKNDRYNAAAQYYSYLSRKYLNQTDLAGAHVKYLTKEAVTEQKLKPFSITGVDAEVSYKSTDTITRGPAIYGMAEINNSFGHNIHMSQSVAFYQQKINERLLAGVNRNNDIDINEFQYYNKLTFNLTRRLQLKTAYHFVHTPFNNFEYNNHVGLVGIKYSGNYIDLQLDGIFAKISDSSLQQYDFQIGVYPLGNLNLYSFSTATLRQPSDDGFNFKEVVGAKVMKNIWLEANATMGTFKNLSENDALYLYNAIDPNKFKGGLTAYISLTKNIITRLGYTFEQRQFYKRTSTFNQHSITGGISWKL